MSFGFLPSALAACVGGGSNAIGLFHAFLDDKDVELYGFEAAGDGMTTNRHAATLNFGRTGVLHGAKSYLLQDERRANFGKPFDLSRSRLPRCWPRACLA
jgi:tryptophan synthase beta chain